MFRIHLLNDDLVGKIILDEGQKHIVWKKAPMKPEVAISKFCYLATSIPELIAWGALMFIALILALIGALTGHLTTTFAAGGIIVAVALIGVSEFRTKVQFFKILCD